MRQSKDILSSAAASSTFFNGAMIRHIRSRPNTLSVLLVFSFFLLLYKSALLGAASFEVTTPIDSSKMVHENGYMYVAKLEYGVWPLFEIIDERLERTSRNLALSENGQTLGPGGASHRDIRDKGMGRFSHWNGQAVFSTSDGSDPRTNGRAYIARTTARPAQYLVYIVLAFVWVAGLVCSKRIEPAITKVLQSMREHALGLVNLFLSFTLAALLVFATGFFGGIGDGVAKPSGLGMAIFCHGLIGFVIALFPFFLGGGILGLGSSTRNLSIAARLLAGFPLGLPAAMLAAALLISTRYGWLAAAIILCASIAGWLVSPPDWRQLSRYLKLAIMVLPFGMVLSCWAAVYWHGPFHGSAGHSPGDFVFYTTNLQLLSTYGLPLPQFGLEGDIGGIGAYFANLLFPVLGAATLHLIPVDPSLFLICSTFITYVVGMSLVIVAFKEDIAPQGLSLPVFLLLALALLAAGRYPLWIIESPPVSHALVLAVCVAWLALKAQRNILVLGAGLGAALVGSALSKVVTFGVLAPLALAPSVAFLSRAPLKVRIGLALLCGLGGIYCLAMLGKFLPGFLASGRLGPETFLYVITDRVPLRTSIVFILRDLSAVLLITAWFRMFKWPIAVVLTIGALSFLAYAFLFQINHGVVILATALLVVASPVSLSAAPISVFLGICLALPAFLSTDYTGSSAATLWLFSIGSTICCLYTLVRSEQTGTLSKKIALRLSIAAMVAVMLATIAIERGFVKVESPPSNLIPASAVDIWQQVKTRTAKDVLVFTDQTSPTNWEMLGGWNNFALSGERQIYVANWVQTSLRADLSKREQIFAINDAVLSGALPPDKVATSRTYSGFVAVVGIQRQMNAPWQLVYRNEDWAIYQWSDNR
jgi:hypothetical protein